MESVKTKLGHTRLKLNREGFLQDPGLWNRETARLLAKREGIVRLTEMHWVVINYIRDFYLENSIAPMVRKICKISGLRLKVLYEMFPRGLAKSACKIAGLPDSRGCI